MRILPSSPYVSARSAALVPAFATFCVSDACRSRTCACADGAICDRSGSATDLSADRDPAAGRAASPDPVDPPARGVHAAAARTTQPATIDAIGRLFTMMACVRPRREPAGALFDGRPSIDGNLRPLFDAATRPAHADIRVLGGRAEPDEHARIVRRRIAAV